jgi:hypothetical protein
MGEVKRFDGATGETATQTDAADPIREPALWRDSGWTARVIQSEDDEG